MWEFVYDVFYKFDCVPPANNFHALYLKVAPSHGKARQNYDTLPNTFYHENVDFKVAS
eukprot:c6_g1_i1 orf=105-278(-)